MKSLMAPTVHRTLHAAPNSSPGSRQSKTNLRAASLALIPPSPNRPGEFVPRPNRRGALPIPSMPSLRPVRCHLALPSRRETSTISQDSAQPSLILGRFEQNRLVVTFSEHSTILYIKLRFLLQYVEMTFRGLH